MTAPDTELPSFPSFLKGPLPGAASIPGPRDVDVDGPLAAGAPILFRGADDGFEVDEIPSYLPSGSGEHLYLHIEKRGLSTPQVVKRLFNNFQIKEREVGVAGNKDARGITRQWLSVPARLLEPRLAEVEEKLGVTLLESGRHGNKLRMGHNRGNRFVCRLDDVDDDSHVAISTRLERLTADGLPNAFGTQRFGHDDRTLRDAERWLTRQRRAITKREQFWVSAVQSAIFNTWLDARLKAGLWNRALDGDVLEKRENGAGFLCDDVADGDPRAQAGDVSATGPLPGAAMRCAVRDALTFESRSLDELGVDLVTLMAHPAFDVGTRRVGRVWPTAVEVRREPTSTTVCFGLPGGSYASVFLAELVGPRLVDRFFSPAPPAAEEPTTTAA